MLRPTETMPKKPKKEIVVTLCRPSFAESSGRIAFLRRTPRHLRSTQPDTSTAAVGGQKASSSSFPDTASSPSSAQTESSVFLPSSPPSPPPLPPSVPERRLPPRYRLTQNGRRGGCRPETTSRRSPPKPGKPSPGRFARNTLTGSQTARPPIKALRRSIPGGWRKLLWNGTTGNNG